jgi:carboxyl-terminal processing protease
MLNKKFPLILTILALVISIGLNGCSNIHRLKATNEIFYCIESMGKSPKEVFLQAWKTVKNSYVDETCNHQDWSRWRDRYIDKIKTRDDAYLAIQSMLESLDDPYTRFLTPYDFAEQDRNIDAKLFGIGVHISKIKDNIVIVHIIDDTPAKQSGLKPGDIITKVNNKSTKALDTKDVADLVRGKVNTKVSLTILRNKRLLLKEVTRKEINLKSVEYKVLKDNLAYIRITSFISNETAFEMLKALNATQNARGVIIDLRGNQGGLLPNAIFIANMFMDKGTIVNIVDKNGSKEVFSAKPFDPINRKPVVILINQGSASASEILSGALKDHHRAVLVGETTFGKGKVQKICKLADGSGLNITIAKYLTPNGTDIDKKGIKPDYMVKLTERDFFRNKDPQLDKAKKVLLSELNKQPVIAAKAQ